MADTDVGWLHVQGIVGLLSPLPYQVFVGEVTGSDPGSGAADEILLPYLVVWPPPADRPTVTLAGYSGQATTTTQITAAGRASAALHRRRPSIPGRRCGLITLVPGAATPPQPQPDNQVRLPDGRPVYFTFAQFTLYSTRSTDG